MIVIYDELNEKLLKVQQDENQEDVITKERIASITKELNEVEEERARLESVTPDIAA